MNKIENCTVISFKDKKLDADWKLFFESLPPSIKYQITLNNQILERDFGNMEDDETLQTTLED